MGNIHLVASFTAVQMFKVENLDNQMTQPLAEIVESLHLEDVHSA